MLDGTLETRLAGDEVGLSYCTGTGCLSSKGFQRKLFWPNPLPAGLTCRTFMATEIQVLHTEVALVDVLKYGPITNLIGIV